MRVFLADDHELVRCGVKQVLTQLGGFEVVGEADDGRQVLNAPELARCDVLVLDLSLPKVSGPEVLRRVKERYPFLAVVVLSMHPEDPFAARSLADGASFYVSKERPPKELIAAVLRAGRGERERAPRRVTDGPAVDAPPHARLTRREHQIFMLMVSGRSVVEAAAELDVHACTVSNHLANVKRKLGASGVADLVRYAITHGLTTVDVEAPTSEGCGSYPTRPLTQPP